MHNGDDTAYCLHGLPRVQSMGVPANLVEAFR
jgi:hypothetical protein